MREDRATANAGMMAPCRAEPITPATAHSHSGRLYCASLQKEAAYMHAVLQTLVCMTSIAQHAQHQLLAAGLACRQVTVQFIMVSGWGMA